MPRVYSADVLTIRDSGTTDKPLELWGPPFYFNQNPGE